MERRLTKNEIRYLLDHLAPMYKGADLSEFLVIGEPPDKQGAKGEESARAKVSGANEGAGAEVRSPAILIPASDDPLDEEEVIKIGGIPVLFPCSPENRWYSEEGKSIRFHHDILKSAFYLLSGYQEHGSDERDGYGRFPWEASIQFRLGITGIPVVNYYFDVLLEAIELLSKKNGLAFRKEQWEAPVLFLSHDVDRIKKYSFRNMAYVGLQLPGIISSGNNLSKRIRNVADYTLGFLFRKKDPYWNFTRLMEQENQLGISSTWYFLERSGRNNSRYRFSDLKITDLIGKLSSSGHEIGIHGTMESSENQEILGAELQRLSSACRRPVEGIRQHFLKYTHPLTPSIQEGAGLLYDASLGFAEQVGFRNSYAGPFRLYDFDKQKARALWQIPLNVMDVTLLNYMNVPAEAIVESVRPLMEQVARFKGVFGLLWHNCNLDEEEFPGINEAYQNLLELLLESEFEPRTGSEIVHKLKSDGA